MTNLDLDVKLKALVQSERKITNEILMIIQTIDARRSYCDLGFSSLYAYLTKGIGYSESAAQRRISSARLLKDIPQMTSHIQTGELNLSQISLAQMALRQEEKSQGVKISTEKKEEILSKVMSQNFEETKRILKQEFPQFSFAAPKSFPLANDRVRITLEFSQSEWKDAQELLASMSHRIPNQKLEDLILYLISKGKRYQNAPPIRLLQSVKKRRKRSKGISKTLRAQVLAKADGKCEFVSSVSGRRCDSKHFLEIDHKHPVALGGGDDLENLRVLCRSHNNHMAKMWGLIKQESQKERDRLVE